MQWMAAMKDTTYTVGAGVAFAIVPSKLDLDASYAYSDGNVDIEYSGFGTVSSVDPANALADNYQFAFRSPPDVRSTRHTVNASLGYQVLKNVAVSVRYFFERFHLDDWSQGASAPWFQAVNGNEFLLRDTSQSTQWGNRLPNLGSYLAPGYDAYVASLFVTVRI